MDLLCFHDHQINLKDLVTILCTSCACKFYYFRILQLLMIFCHRLTQTRKLDEYKLSDLLILYSYLRTYVRDNQSDKNITSVVFR